MSDSRKNGSTEMSGISDERETLWKEKRERERGREIEWNIR